MVKSSMGSKKENNVGDLIKCLTDLKEKGSLLLESISNFDLLVESLNELDTMVEMKEAKSTVIAQVKFLIVNSVFLDDKKNDKHSFEGHMLHTVIAGSPGSGKTHLGIILAKIWTALGLLKKPNNTKSNLPNNVP